MFNPRGNMHQRPRGPSLRGQPPSGPRHGGPQQFMGRETGAGFSRPDVQVTQHRTDPRQARERRNQQKEEGRATRWDNNPFPRGNSNQSQPASGRLADPNPNVQSRYTNESASSILASFGLSNEDLEELSRYPDDQLTPENMPLILRDIRMRKMACQLPSLPIQSREKLSFPSDEGRGSLVKSKVIDYGHESKYGYSEGPLDVKVYDSGVSTEETMKGFQAQQTVPTAPSGVASNPINIVEELIQRMGFQKSTLPPQNFFAMDAANKMPGLCLPPPGPGVPGTAPPMMPPMPPPMMPPVQPHMPPPPIPPPMMPPMNQPPPHFVPEMLQTVNRHDRIQHDSRANPPNAPAQPTGGQKNFQKAPEGPLESPFGVVKASWLPVFSQADAQKLKRLPTPSMMNDYYAASPRIFPHMCSLCNVECRNLKGWIEHQNVATHIESCRQLRQQYPDWNPEAQSSSKRRGRDRQDPHAPRRHSASPSPKRSRLPSSGHARHRSRSRSPGYRNRPRSRSPRRLPSPRHRPRSPWRSLDFGSQSTGSSSRERESGRSRSADKALEAVVKCLGPKFVEQFNKQKSQHEAGRGTSGPRRTPLEPGKTLGNVKEHRRSPAVPQKTSKRDSVSHYDPSNVKAKPPEGSGMPDGGGVAAEGKERKLPRGAPVQDTVVAHPLPYHRLLSDKVLSCGTVLCISDLPDDGYTDQDIEKIVLPFGKVSDFVVIRSRNEAFLEMNYKEAVIAAVKYGETVPVLVNGRRVKINIAEKPKPLPSQPQNKENEKKAVQSVKKPPLNTKKEKTKSAAKTPPTASPGTPTAKPNEKKPGEPRKVGETKAGVEKKKADDPVKPRGPKAPVEQKKAADPKKTEEAKKPVVANKITDAKKTVDSKAKETNSPTETPVTGTAEASQSTEAGDSAIKEAEETCVVVISNLPEAGLSLDEISTLAKPFGGLKDVLILSSHKKAYLEISQKSADSLVKFYSCFPKWAETSKLCISMAPEFKDIKNEEAIFIAMIKDANPKVDVESLHSQFVHLGNLPDGGYSELEILCVGLRFGRVDHYMVISNKKKAILQLDSAESAASMCRFLKRYPYRLGESQLSFSRSRKIEPLPVEVPTKEVKKQEPSKASPVLKKNPEGSGLVQAASVPSAKPTEAEEEPSSKSKAAAAEVKKEPSEKVECEAPSDPPESATLEGEGAALTTKAGDLSLPEVKPEKASALSSSLGEEEKVPDKADAELLGNASTSTARDEDQELASPAGELSEELKGGAQTEGMGADPAKTEQGAETAPAICETVLLGSTEAPVEELSGEDLQSDTQLEPPGTDHTDASRSFPERSPSKVGVMAEGEPENPSSTMDDGMEAEPETPMPETTGPAEGKPELQTGEAEAASEKQPEVLISMDKSTQEEKLGKEAGEGRPEQSLPKTQLSKEMGPDQPEESAKAEVLATELAPRAEATSVSKTILKALMSVPNISKKRTVTRREEEEQKPSLRSGTRSSTAAEKKPVPKEASHQRRTNSRSNLPDSKSKRKLSSPVVKVGRGKSSSQQDKDSQVEAKGSSKQTQEQEARSSSTKRDSSKEKASAGRNTRRSNSGTNPKEEEELFPFNLDEFVTVDEVTDEADSPSQPRRNPLRAKRKDAAHEPSSKRRKTSKTSVAHEQELSFVTLDEIGEDEGGMAQVVEHLEAMPDPQVLVTVDEVTDDPQVLVTVDEVNDEEEIISEVAQDPQALVTLDEISEQEDPAAQEAMKEADREPDLKEEPLVTVDEIGEVEELPLNEPLHFKTETLNDKQKENEVLEDSGDFFSSEVPEDPSTLVTVDEIHEDNDDQPLVTLDEVTEEDDDFLEGEFNFVTVDEVGSEDEEEVTVTSTDMEDAVCTTVPEKEAAVAVAEPMEGLPEGSAKREETVTLEPASPGEKVCPGEDLPEEKKTSEAQMEVAEEESVAAETDAQEPTLLDAEKERVAAETDAQETTFVDVEKESVAAEMDAQETTFVDAEKESVAAETDAPETTFVDAEKERVAAGTDAQETTSVESEKGEGGKDLDQTLKEGTEAEAEVEPPLADSTSNRTEQPDNQGSDMEDRQQPSELESCEEDVEANATEMDVEGSSESATPKEQSADVVIPAPALEVSVEDRQTASGEDPEAARHERLGPDPGGKEESCSAVTPSQLPEKKPQEELPGPDCEGEEESKQGTVDSSEGSKAPDNVEELPGPECEGEEESEQGTADASEGSKAPDSVEELPGPECEGEEESEQGTADASEESKAPDNVEDLDFLVPKAGFFCQICSCFCVDEASMKSHCQSAFHQQNKKKFMSKKAGEEEEKREGDDGDSARGGSA